jgi:protein MpaA
MARRSCALVISALSAVTLVVASATASGSQTWPLIRSPVAGYELRYPTGWHAVRLSDGELLVSSQPVSSAERARPGTARPPGSALIWTFDYGRLHHPLAPLPRRLKLPAPTGIEGFGNGSTLSFSVGDHQLQAFVLFGTGASPRVRALVVETLETLRATGPALPNTEKTFTLGHSVDGRPIRAVRLGDPRSPRTLLIVGCIHGTECAGTAITLALINDPFGLRSDVWVIQNLNPDGLAAGTRQNARGVDLNRNFGSGWRRTGKSFSLEYSGPRPFSEPETRIARSLIERIHPQVTIWFHQHADLVRAWGASIPAAREYAKLVGLPFRALPWLAGTAPNWQNHRFPGSASFVVELPAGQLSFGSARRYADAIVKLAG